MTIELLTTDHGPPTTASPTPYQCNDLNPVAGGEGLLVMPSAGYDDLVQLDSHMPWFDSKLNQKRRDRGPGCNPALRAVEFHE